MGALNELYRRWGIRVCWKEEEEMEGNELSMLENGQRVLARFLNLEYTFSQFCIHTYIHHIRINFIFLFRYQRNEGRNSAVDYNLLLLIVLLHRGLFGILLFLELISSIENI